MPDSHPRDFGGGLTQTALSPYSLVVTVLCIILVMVLPRKYAALPLLFAGFAAASAEEVNLAGLHFYILRIVILAGLVQFLRAKPMSVQEALVARYNPIDSAFIWCMIVQAIANIVLYREVSALMPEFGFLIYNPGAYLLFRRFFLNREDMYRALKFLAIICGVLAVGMVIEHVKGINVFGFVGGSLLPNTREGKVRAQGPFAHPLTAGCFAATLLPLFVMLWKNGEAKFLAVIGILGATVMTIASNSSTPLMAYAGGVLAVALWPIRRRMRAVRWGLATGLVALHLVMKAPVWFLIARVDLTGSSNGYHRAQLVDLFIRHFWDWCLIGVKDTGTWGWDLWDTQNQFVTIGESGGLAAFIFFIVVISRCFGRIGDARKAVAGDTKEEWQLWLLGSTLFANIVAFFGVNYFDQSKISWMMFLAMISTITVPILEKAKESGLAKVETRPIDFPQPGELIASPSRH